MTQSSWTAISNRIVAQLATIANIGRVHPRARLLTDMEQLLDESTVELGGERKLRMWMVHLEIARRSTWQDQGGNAEWDRLAVIEGFLQVEDENDSERTAIALGESVIRVLNTDVRATKLGGTVLWGGPASFPQAPRPAEVRQWGPVVAHYVRVELPLSTIESP